MKKSIQQEHITSGWSSSQRRLRKSSGIFVPAMLIIGLLTVAVFVVPTTSQAATISVGISVGLAPPPISVYTQPVCPGPGYMWTPGYWAYDPDNGYFWVPGTWVVAPAPGLLWTPGYWGWGGAAFIWHAGYWGPHVGFYGGINYGFGYTGVGFVGGEWRGGTFFYNRSVVNIGGAHITNVYYRSVPNNFAVNRISYNGGRGGINARPGREELIAEHDRHMEATSLQRQHEMAAHNDRSQFVCANHGVPGVAATGRPGQFNGGGVVHSTRAGGPVNPAQYRGATSSRTNTYSAARSPNPGGGGTHQAMTAHSNAPSPHGSSPREEEMAKGGSHSTSPPRNEPSRRTEPNHAAESRSRQTQAHSAKPSGGKEGEKRENDPHR